VGVRGSFFVFMCSFINTWVGLSFSKVSSGKLGRVDVLVTLSDVCVRRVHFAVHL